MENEQFSLRWNNFHTNLTDGFHDLFAGEDLVDVTLATEGQFVQAHKLVLSVCSPYFKKLFKANPCKHPIVILKDVGHKELQAILQFMYTGEVNVNQDDLPSFLKTAETLQIKGLTDEQTTVPSSRRINLPAKKPVTLNASMDHPLPMQNTPSLPSPVPKRMRLEPSISQLPVVKTQSLTPPVIVDSGANEFIDIKTKPEPVDYDSDIEEMGVVENSSSGIDDSLSHLIQGESSQSATEIVPGSNMFSGLPPISHDSGGSQDTGQGLQFEPGLQFRMIQTCSWCDKSYKNRQSLLRHVANIHGSSRGPFNCPYCESISKNKNALRVHIHTKHSDIKFAEREMSRILNLSDEVTLSV